MNSESLLFLCTRCDIMGMLVHGMMILHGLIYYKEQTRYKLWDMLVVTYMGKTPYVVWYVLTVWYGKNTVYCTVLLRYDAMVRCRGCIIRLNLPGGMVCFNIKCP